MFITPQKTQTKIIWSFGESAHSDLLLKELTHDDLVDAVRFIYRGQDVSGLVNFCDENKTHKTSLMIDLAHNPQGTLSRVERPFELVFGEKVTVKKGHDNPSNTDGLWVETSLSWKDVFKEESTVFLGNGAVVLKVEKLGQNSFEGQVVQGGVISESVELYVKETRTTPSFESLKTLPIENLKGLNIDFVIIPGFVNPKDIVSVKAWIKKNLPASEPWILLKVDNKEVIDTLDTLLVEADGVLISRRELGIFVEPASVPMLTKEIIQTCNQNACIAIVASDMLASMKLHPTPTRAEVSDIANSVIDGTDGVVISEEVSYGPYLQRAIQLCHRTIEDVEANGNVELNWKKSDVGIVNELDAIAYHAYKTAERVQAKALVCITKAGNTAVRLASFRIPMPVIAFTFSDAVSRKLSLVRGIKPVTLDSAPHLDDILPSIMERLKKHSWLKAGDKIVFVTVSLSSVGREASNLFTIQTIDA